MCAVEVKHSDVADFCFKMCINVFQNGKDTIKIVRVDREGKTDVQGGRPE